jgi:ArsR family transcriptional regulator
METLLQGLRAVSEPTRLRILVLCAHAELSVTELVQVLGQSQPRVSRHLKLMVDAGLLDRHQEGSRAFYRLAEDSEVSDLARILVDLTPDDDDVIAVDLERLEEIKVQRAQVAEEYFRRNAKNWDDLRGEHIDDDDVDARLKRRSLSAPVRDLLDIGTGTGRVLRLVGDEVRSAVGVDNSREMLAIARSYLDQDTLRNCQVRHGDMYRLPFPAHRFDAVTANMLMHYADNPGEMVREAARVLRPGGRLVVVDFATHDLTDLRERHAHRWLGFSDSDVERLFKKAGLELQNVERIDGGTLTVCIWTGRSRIEVANDLVAEAL